MSKTISENNLGKIIQNMQDQINALQAQVRVSTFQAGDIRGTASVATLDGWLKCDGSLIKRVDYPALNAAMADGNYPYGAGDGSTTFGIPDLQGRTPIGSGSGLSLSVRALGALLGLEGEAMSIAQMPSHGHTATSGTESADHSHSGTTNAADRSLDHLHTVPNWWQNVGQFAVPGSPSFYTFGLASTTGAMDRSIDHLHGFTTGGRSAAHTHTIAVNSNGSGTSFSKMQPSTVVNFFIKT